MARSVAAVCIVLLAGPLLASAYPYLWATDVLPGDVLKGAPYTPTNCIRHPTTKEGGHKAPTPDRAITITAADASGKAVQQLCPGETYTVTVKYPEPRRTLLTTTEGAWEKANGTCKGLTLTTKPEEVAPSFTATMTLPCTTTAASTTLQVTSAAGPTKAFQTASAQLSIAPLSKCPTSSCAANETLAAGNETLAGNATAAGNETITDEDMPLAANATGAAADNATAPDAVNATGSGAGAKGRNASKAADASGKPAEPAKPKSAAAAASPFSMVAAAVCVVAMGAIML